MSARRFSAFAMLVALALALAACSAENQPKALATLIAGRSTPAAAAGSARTPTVRSGTPAPIAATVTANATARLAVSPTPASSSGAVMPTATKPMTSPVGVAGVASPTAAKPSVVRTITIESPVTGDAFLSGSPVKGKVSITPSEKNLVYRVYNGKGQEIGSGAVTVTGDMGQPGTFDTKVQFSAYKGAGWIEIIDQNEATGAAFASAAVDVYLGESKPPSTRPSAQVLAPRKIIIDAAQGWRHRR